MTLYDLWHDKSHFASGVALLVDNAPGAVTRAILARLQTLAATGAYIGTYEWGKLEYALRGAEAPHGAKKGRESVARPGIPVAADPGNNVSLPPIGGAGGGLTSDHAKTLHKEHAHVHALMVNADTDEERAGYARDIMERIIPALDAEYDRLRAAPPSPPDGGEIGSQPGLGNADTPDNVSLPPVGGQGGASSFRKLQSVRSRISTLRKKIAKENDHKRKAKLEKELETKIAEKERLEEQLA